MLKNTQNVLKTIKLLTMPQGFSLSSRRITISTAGIIPEIHRFGEMKTGVKLAISLNASDDKTRTKLMPINSKYPLKYLIKELKEYPFQNRQEKITYEYVLIKNINDSDADAKRLTKLLSKKRSKVNLIPFNPVESTRFTSPDDNCIESLNVYDVPPPLLSRPPLADEYDNKSQSGDIYASCTSKSIGAASSVTVGAL